MTAGSTAMLVAVLVMAAISFSYKAVPPALLGDREFPDALQQVVDAFGPALLAGLLVVNLAGTGWREFDLTAVAGLVAAGVAWRLRVPDLVCLLIAVAVTAGVRWATSA